MKEFSGYGHIDLVYDGKDMSYVLSVMIDLEKEGYRRYMPSLGFYKNYGLSDEEYVDSWDSDEYLYNTLYSKVLLPWSEGQNITSPEEFTELIKIKGVCTSDLIGLKNILDHAITLGFFEQLKEKENGTEQNRNK